VLRRSNHKNDASTCNFGYRAGWRRPPMKYIVAVILFVIAVGAWGSALGIYYASTWGGTLEQPCSRSAC
jgi:hypothetical protein